MSDEVEIKTDNKLKQNKLDEGRSQLMIEKKQTEDTVNKIRSVTDNLSVTEMTYLPELKHVTSTSKPETFKPLLTTFTE